MPGELSDIICPRCLHQGGFLQTRWVKRTTSIPRKEGILSVADAWEYAAKVNLRLREYMILFPPNNSFDKRATELTYDYFNLGLHSDDEIKAFEARHLIIPSKNLRTKLKQLTLQVRSTATYNPRDQVYGDFAINKLPAFRTVHTKVPQNAGHVTRSSVSYLYAAIVCYIFRDISKLYPFPEEFHRELAYSIYTRFSMLENGLSDLRYAYSLPRWISILQDAEKYGYGNAAQMNAQNTNYCKNCSSRKKNTDVLMEESLQGDSSKLKCPKCGGEESLKRRLTIKQMHNKRIKIWKKIEDIAYYVPMFRDLLEDKWMPMVVNKYVYYFRRLFEEYEKIACKDLLSATEYNFIGHYDSTKKSKRKWCPITNKQAEEIKGNILS